MHYLSAYKSDNFSQVVKSAHFQLTTELHLDHTDFERIWAVAVKRMVTISIHFCGLFSDEIKKEKYSK